MQKKSQKLLLLSSLLCLAAPLPAVAATKAASKAQNKPIEAKEVAVTYTQVGFSNFQYSSFLKPWDEKQHPNFYALIRTEERFKHYFQPAYLMDNNKPAGPSAEFFSKKDLLVIARHLVPSATKDVLFTVERLVEKNKRLELHYRYAAPQTPSTYTMTDGLMLELPRQPYEAVDLYENGSKIGTLQLKQGQLSMDIPAPIIAVPPKH